MKTAQEIFEAVDKQGWNWMEMLHESWEFHAEDSTLRCWGEEVEDGCHSTYQGGYAVPEIFYDKTEKNFCQCIAEIKLGKVGPDDTGNYRYNGFVAPYLYWLPLVEQEIRHKLLCEDTTGDWVKVIKEWLRSRQ